MRPDDIEATFVPCRGSDVAGIELDGEMVLGRLAPDSDALTTYALNATASIVWQCFDGSGTIDEISRDLADVSGTDVGVIGRDILALARDLGRAGLLAGVEEDA